MLSLLVAISLHPVQAHVDPKKFFDPGPAGPSWQGQGGIKSDDFKVERRDDNGNVVGTEFVHLEMNVSCREVPLPPSPDDWAVQVDCDANCKGGKHKTHAECDMSCDTPCKKNHHFTLKGDYDELRDNMNKMTADSGALTAHGAAGAADPPDWSSEVSHALRDAENAVRKEVVDMTPAHINKPCTLDTRMYGYTTSQFQVHCDVHKIGFYMTKGVKTPIDDEIGSLDGVVALLYHPSKDVLHEESEVACKCVKKIDPIESWTGFDPFPPIEGGVIWQTPDGTPVYPEDGKVTVGAHGVDLNEGEIDIDNESDQDLKLTLLPGLLLFADDDDIQTMVILEMLSQLCAAKTETRIYVSTSPQPAGKFVLKPRVACTEISKHQPTSSSKMHLAAPKDDHLTALCRMYGKTQIHFGGVDQVRVWICASQSTMDQINQRLFPKVSAGTYLNALKDVASTGVDVDTKAYRQCEDMALLEGATARTDSVKWYVRFWEGHDLKSMESYAAKLVAHEKQACAAGQAIELRHLADLAQAFLSSTDPAIRDAGLRLLSEAVPEDKRKDVVQYHGLDMLWKPLSSGDEAEVVKALGVVELYQDKSYAGQVAGLAGYSQNATIKSTAKALQGKLK
jgi:hypothetical protein